MIKPETRKILEAFIERVEYIQSLSYLDGKDSIAGFNSIKVGDKWQVEFYQPSDEKRDAVLFNIRLFLQDKDDISIRNLSKLDDPGISNQWKQELKVYRQELNDRLDRIAAEGPKGNITHRDVLNMFLYGKFGHQDQDDHSYKLYKKWVKNETEYEILHNSFHKILIWILVIVTNISIASKEELQRHSK
jgi:hypothetical protein